MGFFDKVKEKAGDIAGDTARAGKVAQAQMKIKSLNGDIEKAKAEIGAAALELIEKGELSNPAFSDGLAKVTEARAAIAAKEAEIAELKAQGAEGAEAATAAAAPVADAPAADESSATLDS